MKAHLAQVIDRVTGSEFELRTPSDDREACIGCLNALGFIVGPIAPSPPLVADPEYRSDMARQQELAASCEEIRSSQLIPRGKIARAQSTENLDELVNFLNWESHPIDRHFLLQYIVQLAYTIGNPDGASEIKARATIAPERAWPLVERFGWQWIVEMPYLRPYLIEQGRVGYELPQPLDITVTGYLRKHLKKCGFKARAADVERIEERYFAGDSSEIE